LIIALSAPDGSLLGVAHASDPRRHERYRRAASEKRAHMQYFTNVVHDEDPLLVDSCIKKDARSRHEHRPSRHEATRMSAASESSAHKVAIEPNRRVPARV
jgi:hypothetical protein